MTDPETAEHARLTREELIERVQSLERRLSVEAAAPTPRSMSEEKYHNLFTNMVEEVHFWKLVRDGSGNIKTWRLVDINPATERSWGRVRAEVIGRTADEIFDTATAHFMPIVTKIFEDGEPYSWETYFPDIDQYMRMTSVPFGEYFFTTGFNISEIKKSSLKQEKLSMMARMATEASDIGVWELDLETGRLTWNEHMSRIFGTDPETLTNTAQDWSDRLHPDDKQEMLDKLESCFETGENFVGNFRIITPSGETRFIKARSEVLKSEISQSLIMIGTNIDITEQETLIDDLRESREMATISNAAKSEFLASMSHELRTPMNAVLGYSQMLQLTANDHLSAKEKQYLDYILQSGQHLLALINDVLDLSQIEAGRLEVDEEELDLLEILAQAESVIQPISKQKAVTIRVSSAPSCLPHIRSDRIRVNQILLNLLSNGVKYTPEGGQVTLSARIVAPQRVRLSVTDTGCGIAKADQVLIFNPFTRLHGNHMITTEGIGIGLAVSKKLAEQLGGTIGVDSQIGAGSTFWVEFPCAKCGSDCPDLSQEQTA